MPRFTYSAREAGEARQGSLDAASRQDAARQLQARGWQVVRLTEEGAAPAARNAAAPPPAATRGFTARERLPFLEALSELVHAGMSAGEAVRLLAVRLQEPRLRALCAALWQRIGEGLPLSGAMAASPEVFDRQTVNLVAAGEATGNLREVLARLITHFTRRAELRQQFLASLAYPAFICGLGFAVVLFLVFFLMPRLQTLLTSLGGSLPVSTRLLMGGSHFLLYYGPFLAIGLAASGVIAWRWRRSPAGRAQSDAWLLRAPLVREFAVRAAVFDFAHTLAVLLENGVTTAEALRLTERAISNTAAQALLREATDRVIEGSSLSAALARTGLVEPLYLDRLAVGEQTGHLVPGLRQIADSYQTVLVRRLQQTTKLASGTVLFLTFGFVTFLAYAIVSAIFQLTASIRL